MNNTSLLTIGKKLKGNDLYLLSVFDLEPSGIIIHAYNQLDSTEYTLPISEFELSSTGLTRNTNSLNILLASIELVTQGDSFTLQSTIDEVSKTKAAFKVASLAAMLSDPLQPNTPSLNDVLVKGLVELCKCKPVGLDAVSWLGNWLLTNNPVKPIVDDE